MRSYLLVVTALAGCLKPDLVECSDGTACPGGTTCDEANQTCIDPQGLSIPTGKINLGSVGCGTLSSQIMLPISNFGSAPIDVRLGSTIVGVTVTPEQATILPHETLQALVQALAATESYPGTAIEGSITIRTPYELLERSIQFETKGGIATADDVDFGTQFSGTSTTASLMVRNSGNAPFMVVGVLTNTAGVFSLPDPSTVIVEPDHSTAYTLQFTPGASTVGDYTGKVMLAYTQNMCQQPTTAITVNASASGDVVIVDHTKVDFGTSVCGAPAQGITLTVANRSTTAQTVALKLTGADAASFRTLPEIALPAGSSTVAVSASTTITRLAIPAKSPLLTQAAQLEIDFKEAGITKVLPVQSVISAPVLASDVELIDFGIVGKTGVVTRGARISNSGMLGTVTISPTVVMGANGSKLTVSPTTFQIPRSGIVPITFTFTGGVASGGFPETTFTLSSPGQCSTPPAIKVVASTGT